MGHLTLLLLCPPLSNCKISTIENCASLYLVVWTFNFHQKSCKWILFHIILLWLELFCTLNSHYKSCRQSLPQRHSILKVLLCETRQSLPQKHSILKVLLCKTEPETNPKIAKHGSNLTKSTHVWLGVSFISWNKPN